MCIVVLFNQPFKQSMLMMCLNSRQRKQKKKEKEYYMMSLGMNMKKVVKQNSRTTKRFRMQKEESVQKKQMIAHVWLNQLKIITG